jgi:hypothetical protein
MLSYALAGIRVVLLAVLLALAAGCSGAKSPQGSSSGSATKAQVTACGHARTAANVPVDVEIVQGHVSCEKAMAIEKSYAKAIRAGLAPGNGGGGPIKIKGWTCEGYATPKVLRTGQASQCVSAGNKILEILPTPA